VAASPVPVGAILPIVLILAGLPIALVTADFQAGWMETGAEGPVHRLDKLLLLDPATPGNPLREPSV
jgi:hypothetical protein